MKFAFKVALIFTIFHANFAQNGNFDYEVYEFDPSTGSLAPINTMRPPTNRFTMRTTRKYDNNIFLNQNTESGNSLSMMNNRNMNNNDSDGGGEATSCDSVFTIKRDYTGMWGQLALISIGNRNQISLRIILKVTALLTSVRQMALNYLYSN